MKGNQHGAYLIRKSENKTGQNLNWFALSIRDGDLVKHYKIKTTDSGMFFIARRLEFDTLQDLVAHYTQQSDGLVTTLSEPCKKV